MVVVRDGAYLVDVFFACRRDVHFVELMGGGQDGFVDAGLMAKGLVPSVKLLRHSRKIQWVSTVAVVVPCAVVVGRLGRDFVQHLRVHVLERIGELDILVDCDAVVLDGGRAEIFVDEDVRAAGVRASPSPVP